jgi:hypothetical protein
MSTSTSSPQRSSWSCWGLRSPIGVPLHRCRTATKLPIRCAGPPGGPSNIHHQPPSLAHRLTAGEPPTLVAIATLCELVLETVSGRCAVGPGTSRCTRALRPQHCSSRERALAQRSPRTSAAPRGLAQRLLDRVDKVGWHCAARSGHYVRKSCHAGSPSGPGRVVTFDPVARILIKILFHFQSSFQNSSIFRNSYLFEYCSKIHETNSIPKFKFYPQKI